MVTMALDIRYRRSAVFVIFYYIHVAVTLADYHMVKDYYIFWHHCFNFLLLPDLAQPTLYYEGNGFCLGWVVGSSRRPLFFVEVQ